MIPASDHPPHRLRGLRGPTLRRMVLVGLLAISFAFALMGCSTPEQRYRVLSFFFDGVPVPESVLREHPELAFAGRSTEDTGATEPRATVQPAVIFYHAPYADGVSCGACHDRRVGNQLLYDGGPQMCQECHGSHFNYQSGDWGHGPAVLGECRLCHDPHKSEHPGLLTGPQPDLCLACHDTPDLLEQPHHITAKAGQDRCGRCHDPHLAGNRRLLVDSRTYRNRRLAAFRPLSVHAPYRNNQCGECHVISQANRVRDDIDAACRNCHGDMIAAAQAPGSPVHEAVAQGKCIACHSPHNSPRQHLLRTTAEQMCVDCHQPEALAAAQHPASVVRVDCLICHRGHESDLPHLLRQFELTAPEEVGPPPAEVAAPASGENDLPAAVAPVDGPHPAGGLATASAPPGLPGAGVPGVRAGGQP